MYRHFGSYLIGKKAISKDQIIDAMRYQRAVGKKFGEIAVSRKYMTEKDAETIAKKQRVVDKKFGEIAVQDGFLTETQIQDIMNIQLIDHIELENYLFDLGLINETEMLEEVRLFKQEQQSRIMDDLKIPEKEKASAPTDSIIVTVMSDVVSRLLVNMANIYIKLQEVKIETIYTFNPLYCVIIKAAGTIKGKFLLKLDRGITEVLVSNMMGMSLSELDDALIADTAGEFLNIVLGHIHTRLRQEGLYFTISPPLVYHSSQEQIIRFAKNERSIVLPFLSPQGLTEMQWIEEAAE